MAEMDTSREDDEGVGYHEMGVDIGEEAEGKQSPETVSQQGVEETDGKATKKKKKAAQRIIQDGLLLSLKGHKQAFISYTYALTPGMDSSSRVDWKVLTTEDVECQHIYYHQLLTGGDTLASIAAKHRKSHTVAVILGNVENNLELAAEFSEGMGKSKKNALPMVLISSEDGASLKEFLGRHDPGELHAKIESKNQSHVDFKSRASSASRGSYSPEVLHKPRLKSSGGIRRSMRHIIHRRSAINLKEELKSLMFPISGPVCICEDEELFKNTMITFYQHEQSVVREGKHGDSGAVFRKLSKHLDEQFAKDFPFYLLVAYRVHRNVGVYQSDEMRPFVRSCVEKFEKLEQASISKTLESFLKKENFKVMLDATETDQTIFKLLEDACVELMKLSFMYKSQDVSQAKHRAVYYRMLWISVAFKCHIQRGAPHREYIDYWQEHLTNTETFTHLNTDTIQSIKRGVEFGRLLQLPDEVSFSSQHMGDVLTAGNVVRPFHQIREFVIVLEPYVQLEEVFVDCFLTSPRTTSYGALFHSKQEDWFKLVHPDGNLLAILQEGISFLDTVLEVSRNRQWLSKGMNDEMKEWLTMLLAPVDITSEKAESYLKDFLTTKMGGVTKLFSEHVKRDVIVKMQDNFHVLKVERFLQLYKAFLIWPTWVVEKYLRQYKIPQEVKICSSTWNEFFSEFVDRFKDAQHHNFLLEFLKSVGRCYLEQRRAKDFIMDLLELNVPDLFMMDTEDSTSTVHSDILSNSVPDEFTEFLTEYIHRNHLHEAILKDVEKIWELVAEQSNFQQLILLVLQQELIPESLAYQGTMSPPLKLLLKNCVETICKNLDTLCELSSRLEFCWGVVGACCTKMPVSESLEWAKSYYHIIDQLGRIYSAFCLAQELEDTRSVLSDDTMPLDVAQSSCEGVKEFFSWLSRAQQVLSVWREKFTSKKINYDSIMLYTEVFSLLSRAATSLSANTLVVDAQYVQAIRTDFLQAFELLNIMLIRYIEGHPEAGHRPLGEILSEYGVEIPPPLLTTIKQHVSFPGESKNQKKRALALEHSIPASISQTFNPGQDIKLEITTDMDLLQLKQLVRLLTTFLSPVEDNLDLLTFFSQTNSEIFDKYLKHQLKILDSARTLDKPKDSPRKILPVLEVEKRKEKTVGVPIEMLGKALENTKEFVLRLIQGNAMYTEIIASGSLNLRSMDIDLEFGILNSYAEHACIDMQDAEGLQGIKAMLQLFQYARHIQVIHNVCQQYQLEACLMDPDLTELMDLVAMLDEAETQNKLTAKDAINRMNKVTELLFLNSKQNTKFLDLFAAVSDSADFHQFIVQEKQFVGKEGKELFLQQYQLIITHLQHEEYNEVVLNHLFAAFKMITPFTEKELSFGALMAKVTELNAYDGRRQLDTVNRNINLIRLWFTRAEGDTLQGIDSELRCVLESGFYRFHFSSSIDYVSGTVQLLYMPHIYQNVEEVTEMPSLSGMVVWTDDQISDFVRKLGFLDAEGDSEWLIPQFLHLNQTAKKLLDLFTKLRELGHPDFLHEDVKYVLHCTFSQEEADEMVYDASMKLAEWKEMVNNLRSEYEQLLFFSIPKLLHLYQNLVGGRPNVPRIVNDVSILFHNRHDVQRKLRHTVKELIRHEPYLFREQDSDSTPMHVVGLFLSALFKNSDLSMNSLKRRRTGSTLSRSMSQQSTHILHSCQGYTSSQLLRTIISVFGGVPEPFEVFHCRPTVTEEELRLFMNPKRATKHPFQYLILEVNKLPYQLQEALLRIHYDLKQQQQAMAQVNEGDLEIACTHFVETAPSLLQEMPWVLHMDYKGAEPSLDFKQASITCQVATLSAEDFEHIRLVYGEAGDGKTHYIEKELQHAPCSLKIAVNEAFTPLSAIKKLSSELPTDMPQCAVYFNFTMLPPGESVDDQERERYNQLIETVGWFFFDLFLLGYVEDPVTGYSFRFPGGMKWAIYIEVPSRIKMNSEMSLREFFEDIPALGLLGTPYLIDPNALYVVDEDVQLVCKYLRAFKIGGTKGINKLFKEGGVLSGKSKFPIKFSLDPDLSDSDCHKLLNHYTPQHMKRNKTSQKLFIRYMKRRCSFLDRCPAFNFNGGSTEYIPSSDGKKKVKNDTTQLGSTLMETMLREVSDFCDPIIRENWSLKPHHQLIYDFKDGGGSFGLLSLHPEDIAIDEKEKFRKIGVDIPSMLELYSRDKLDSYLSRALNVPLEKNEQKKERLSAIDDSKYVLTLDFAIKMLNINERAECGVPVIIEGETGVGKTALIEMLSKLWNFSLIKNWTLFRERILDFIKNQLDALPPDCLRNSPECIDAMVTIGSGNIREDDFIMIGEIQLEDGTQFSAVIREHLLGLVGDPMLSMLDLREEDLRPGGVETVTLLVASAKFKNSPKETAKLLFRLLNCKVKEFFYKLNVHAALEPSQIVDFFVPIFEKAKELERAYDRFSDQTKVPFITVFLDEVNTSSCLGIFKEVIVDRTIDGRSIPGNIFVIGACNPHRGNSLATVLKKETWIRGTYYVRQLHPTLQCLMWDYGALGEKQEREYISAKMSMSNQDATSSDQATLTDLIRKSQNLMRQYSYEQLQECGLSDGDASDCSRSCVSQRDIQRVFTFYEWLYRMYMRYKPGDSQCDYSFRAVLVSLGLVYYLRLDTKYRKKYKTILDHEAAAAQECFSKSFEEELNWYIDHIDLPDGIARTQALKENLFATIICTMTHTPLIIVGQPGSSKTLSFNLCLANLKGQESKVNVFRQTDIFKSLDPQFYQCSRRTTSNEIQTVFSRAINRQRSHQRVPLPVYCVVFMDEAGLPEERHESLKVLHFYLDKQEVSFVAISNHVLDAAKTNRAVSLFRPEVTQDDLVTLAKGCLCQTPDDPPPELKRDLEFIANLVPAYDSLMRREKFKQFFGLRDFIHFISYLKRKRREMLSPQLVVEALERNFNGVSKKDFDSILKIFLHRVQANARDMDCQNILDILLGSLLDHPEECGAENEMRYKLIIDSSEDGSLVRLLFSTGVLERDKTRVYMCSDFPGDAQLQKVNTIAAVRHSATEGHTVVMSQTDAIHESFYDLFNRRFHRIDANTGPRYYANIAIGAHIKPCRVHKDFECLVVVKESDLDMKNIPQPFLNRFEKYRLSHEIVLEATLSSSPPALSQLLRAVLKKTHEFLESIGQSSSIYGLHKDTVSSILLTMLPPLEHDYSSNRFKLPTKSTPAYEVRNRVMEMTLEALKKNAGFVIPECSTEELNRDMREVLNQVLRDSEFAGRILLMTSETYYDSTGDIYKAVVEAFDALHDPRAELNIHQDTSINALLVISAVTQLLVRVLCKRVMQLMTSDSLCVHHRSVPTSYIQNYLNYQNHFSLKSLIETRLGLVKSLTNSNKLICYTRSSQLLHQLPAQYPSPLHQQTSEESVSILHDIVMSDMSSLTFQKLSSFTSFTTISELLKSFVVSKAKKVLLISVNMQETSKDVLNHLRIMIEETETKTKSESRKLFVLLLHFPSSKLSTPCYTSLFLRGWDYTYLDVIGVSAQGGALIDIREWFKQCYTNTPFPSTRRSIATQLQSLLKEAIPVISSRVYFGKHPASSFNKHMNVMERNLSLQKLFFEKKAGEILCDRFHSYWQPSVMVEYLEKAAQLSQQHETSLSVIDSLQTIFKNLFFDFLVHMVYRMNQGMNIDVLFNESASNNSVELFLDVLRIIPIPKLSEIKMLGISGNDLALKDTGEAAYAPPKFPFFFLVASDVEKLVDQSRREVNQSSVDVLSEYSEPRPSLFHTVEQSRVQVMADMLKTIQSKLEDITKGEEPTCISLTVQALVKSDSLWQQYLEDFTRQKLRLEFGNTGISHKILRAAFGKLEKRSAVQRLALLHVYVHMHKVNLAKVVSILRPLDQIEVAVSVLPSLHSVQVTSPNHHASLLDQSGSEDVLESSEALSVFIVSTLFNAISGIGMSCSSSFNPHVGTREEQEIKVWFQAYRDVISMPALKEHIYGSRSVTTEAQHSIMHALFLIIRSKPSKCSENLQQGLKIFNGLFDKYFKATMELQGDCPRLGDIIAVILEELFSSSYEDSPEPVQIRHIVEGLLAHFFSLHQTPYHPADIRWLLEMANLQTHWQATYLMSEVVEVEYSADFPSNTDMDADCSTVFSDVSSPHKLFVHIPISIFKLYLHRILLATLRSRDDPVHSIMLFFQKSEKTVVHSIISEVLLPSHKREEEPAGPYIPTFYQFFDSISHCASAENEMMQQPLAHLYFLTVFEDLLSSNFGLANLIRTSQRIAKQCVSLPEEMLVLLHIEEQAIVQVIIKEVANHLDIRDNSKINTLYSILEDLNAILDNPHMGGGAVGGHGLVLAMHMLKEQQSFSKFFNLLTENYGHLCDGINCLQPFNKALTSVTSSICKEGGVSSTATLEIGPEFQALYQRVTTAMNNIQYSHGTPAKAKELTRIMDECSSSSAQLNIVTPSGKPATMKKAACFKMALWLVTYHEFFAKSRVAPELAQVVSALKKVEPACLQLICCFLDPSRMIQAEEEASAAGGVLDSPRQPHTHDPLYQLFCPISPNEDHADSDLRAVLVHMVAVTIGCGKSSHLWYSSFQLGDLINTYISGFMYDALVGPSTMFYDIGVELTPEGLYGRHDYLKHATRGTLSLHSLYFVLWSNFASFSLALLTQPGATKDLTGKILSTNEPVRDYCVAQMKKLWTLLRNGLGVSDEERKVLVKGCLNNLLECTLQSTNGLTGRLVTTRELDAYETLWHTNVFTPAWKSLEKEFAEKCSFLKLGVIKDIRNMNIRYPWFPSEQTLSMAVLSNANMADPTGDLYLLSKFVLEYPRLKGGMELLPGVVELYQYLHTEFTYAITYKEATSINLKRLGKVIAKHFVTGDRKAHYEKLKYSFNRYVQLTGCTKYKRPATVGDDTPLLHLLSYSVDGEQGSDLLYTVIVDIITFLNKFVTCLVDTLESTDLGRSYFPNTIPKVHVMEFAQHYMLTLAPRRGNNLLQLVLGRSHLPVAFPTDPSQQVPIPHHSYLPGQLSPLINLPTLQEDVLVTCLAGMPLIEHSSVTSMRIPFKFRDDSSAQFNLRDHAVDLEAIAEKLPEQFKRSLSDETRKRLEYEFHSACYHTDMEVVAGLRTSIGHLIKEVTAMDYGVKSSELLAKALPMYLAELYEYDPQDENKDVFHEIGIHGITQAQHGALSSLALPHLFTALRLFVNWAEDGWYDFCSLPFGAKSPMNLVDEDAVKEIPDRFEGTHTQLLHNLKTLVDVLIHMENTIVKTITEKSHDSIIRFLMRFPEVLPRDIRKLTDMIPRTVLLENYVSLRIVLRKLSTEIQAQVSRAESNTPEPKDEKWSDLVDDLWENHLPYFRKRGYVVSSRPTSVDSFSEEADPSTTILNELTRHDSDQNLLELLKKDAPVRHQAPPSPLPDIGANKEERNLALLKKLTGQVKAEELQRRAKNYSLADVIVFLESKGLGRYSQIFEEFDINGELLIEFHDDELRDIGIDSALDRLRISTYFRRHVVKSEGLAELYPVEAVVQFLQETRPLQQFAASFGENGIDGEFLLNANDEVMNELGVEKGVHKLMIRQKFKARLD